ncbi:MAG TPA: STAS domain-containing protein [Thermoleophilaceae bacterium]|nr:STAS domain-containing protein [Thermoleophilaceae bacterium]
MNPLARLTLETRDEIQVAHITGEVDIANASTLESEISDTVANTAFGLVVDLTETDYFDSAGIRMLFQLRKRLTGRRQNLRVVVPRDSVIITALLVTEVDQIIPIDETVDESLTALTDGDRPPG